MHGGSGDTINLAKTTLTLYGTDEMVFIGVGNATVADFSTGLDLKIGPAAGVMFSPTSRPILAALSI